MVVEFLLVVELFIEAPVIGNLLLPPSIAILTLGAFAVIGTILKNDIFLVKVCLESLLNTVIIFLFTFVTTYGYCKNVAVSYFAFVV